MDWSSEVANPQCADRFGVEFGRAEGEDGGEGTQVKKQTCTIAMIKIWYTISKQMIWNEVIRKGEGHVLSMPVEVEPGERYSIRAVAVVKEKRDRRGGFQARRFTS